ncbi:ABC transporter permease [Aureibacillus halotolerans]|uniref:ABC transporter protein EcsB n=1 Tax=Aureibacillus halotolerans TaxID=1508390 RepID=A0A4R6TS67_9BACI|nr:ABC transporter permease [Aureibacillus halotolerans]TDQ36450.1 ABC transporter protein EcsB [Aureibacillus halotolerans]
MNVRHLYQIRMKEWRKKQWGLFKLLFDWVIAVYFIIPLLVVGTIQWRTIYISPPDFLQELPVATVSLVLMAIVSTNSFRSHFQEADVLFLARQRSFSEGMIRLGKFHIVRFELLKLVLCLLFFLPLWHFYEPPYISFLFSMIFAYKLYRIAYIHLRFHEKLGGILYALPLLCALIGKPWIGGAIALCLGVIYGWRFTRGKSNDPFMSWLAYEEKQATRFIQMIFIGSQSSMKKAGVSDLKPVVKPMAFSSWTIKSKAPEKVLQHIFAKWLLRHWQLLLLLITILGLGSVGIIMLPSWVPIIISIGTLIAVYHFINAVWRYFIEQPFLKMLFTTKKVKDAAHEQLVLAFVGPCALLLVLIGCWRLFVLSF